MRQLASPALRAAEPRLEGLDRLVTRWMNGVLFYLDRDVPLVNGHAIYIDSEWALTSISQKQFWPGVDLSRRGDGRVPRDPVDRRLRVAAAGPAARARSRSGAPREEIFAEVWGQLSDHLDGALDGVTVLDRFLDPAIVFPNPTGAANLEPLLVNTAGSWADRPDAVTRIPNLFLASDYVRTHTDLATMEAANEAARRAVNGILAATGSAERPLRGLAAARAAGVRRRARALDAWLALEALSTGPPRLLRWGAAEAGRRAGDAASTAHPNGRRVAIRGALACRDAYALAQRRSAGARRLEAAAVTRREPSPRSRRALEAERLHRARPRRRACGRLPPRRAARPRRGRRP